MRFSEKIYQLFIILSICKILLTKSRIEWFIAKTKWVSVQLEHSVVNNIVNVFCILYQFLIALEYPFNFLST